MDHLSIVAAYFNQPQIFEEWWRVLRTYPDDIADRVRLFLVDDHSHPETSLRVPDDIKARFRASTFYVEDDIPWNEMGCRNLAMQHAKGWVYMTDPDYILYPEDARKLFGEMDMASGSSRWRGHLERRSFYHLESRLFSDGRVLHRPENIAVLHTTDFWKAGGYDEQFAGGYGFSDALFWRAMRAAAGCRNVFLTDVRMHHYSKGIIELVDGTRILDAASPAPRDTTRNQPIFKRVNTTIAQKGWARYLRERGASVRFRWRQTS